jgi:N-acetyl-anhydromuramyl-L-alanine amidase AmpD
VTPNKATADGLALRNTKWTGADCPGGIACRFIPAFYGKTSATGYGNYDTADRPNFGPEIRCIVIHDTEGSYMSAINWFRDKRSGVSSHYVVRAADGEVTQMVDVKETAWQACNWYFNMHTIGIEHEGVALAGRAALHRSQL